MSDKEGLWSCAKEKEDKAQKKSPSTMVTPSGEQMFELRQGRW
jgi:hypothetical protein